jgi:hypothetical protein
MTALTEFYPPTPSSDYKDAVAAVLKNMRAVTWDDVDQFLAQVWHNAPSGTSARFEVLMAQGTGTPHSIFHLLDLKRDKIKVTPRPNMHSNAILAQQVVCETTPFVLNQIIYELFVSAYEQPDPDLMLYDIVCVLGVLKEKSHFNTLYDASNMTVGSRLKSAADQEAEVVSQLNVQEGTTALAVIAEAPSSDTIARILPSPLKFHVRGEFDKSCPIAVCGIGHVDLEDDLSAHFRTYLATFNPPHESWHTRLVAVQYELLGPGLRGICVGVHWHGVEKLNEYVVCIAAVINLGRSLGVDMVTCSGDFNFKDTAGAQYVKNALEMGFKIKCTPTTEGVPITTTRKRRTPFQCQFKKTDVEIDAPRITEFCWVAPNCSVSRARNQLCFGDSVISPNNTWPLDHAAILLERTLQKTSPDSPPVFTY